MRKVLLLMMLLSVAAGVFAADLVKDGRSDYTIVVSPNAVPTEITASKELQEFIKNISGVEIPISNDENFAGKAILVGQTPRISKLLGVDFKDLKSDEIIVKTLGGNLILSGERPRGVLYAAYEFLEDLGVRQWTSWDMDIPSRKTIELKDYDIRYAPPFFCRDRLGGTGGKFAAWMRVNGHYLGVPESHGGVVRLIGWCHTFGQMIPRKEYHQEHPEYFALVDSQRGPVASDGGEVQLCLTNPDVIKLLTEKTLEWLRKEKDPRIISVSQNDSWRTMANNYCRCDNCRAIDEREESPAGSLLFAVNQVADAVKAEFPQVLVETLAYQYTVKPPKTIRPHDNVVIRYCTRKNVLYPLDSPANANVLGELQAWSKITDKIYIWDYTSNFGNTMMPYPSWRPFAQDIRTLATNHVISVLEQGYSVGEAGDLMPVQNYLLCKLMWNPNLDQEKLTAEVLQGYYGAAAPEIRKYMDSSWEIYRKNQQAAANTSNEFGALVALRVLPKLPLADLLELRTIFDRAEALVKDDPAKLRRVRIAAMTVNFPILFSEEAFYENAAKPEGKALREKIDLDQLAARTAEAVKSLRRPDRYREATEATLERYIDSAEKHVTGNWNKGKKIPAEFAGTPQDDLRIYGPADFSIWYSDTVEKDGFPVINVNSKKGWKVHFSFDPSRNLGDDEWQVLIGLRSKFDGKPGGMIAADVASTHFPTRFVKLADITSDEFKYIDLGKHKLGGQRGYIVLSPSGVDQQLEMQYLILLRNGNYPYLQLPDVCKGLKKDDFRIINQFNYWEPDIQPVTENGLQAIAVKSGKTSALHCPLPALPGRWKIMATLRAEGPQSGNAASLWSKSTGAIKQFNFTQIGGPEYRTVEFGVEDLGKPGLLTFSRQHPATTLYVREVILIRQ